MSGFGKTPTNPRVFVQQMLQWDQGNAGGSSWWWENSRVKNYWVKDPFLLSAPQDHFKACRQAVIPAISSDATVRKVRAVTTPRAANHRHLVAQPHVHPAARSLQSTSTSHIFWLDSFLHTKINTFKDELQKEVKLHVAAGFANCLA